MSVGTLRGRAGAPSQGHAPYFLIFCARPQIFVPAPPRGAAPKEHTQGPVPGWSPGCGILLLVDEAPKNPPESPKELFPTQAFLEGLKCLRCGHLWIPRDPSGHPVRCPECRSYYWDRPRKRMTPKGQPQKGAPTPAPRPLAQTYTDAYLRPSGPLVLSSPRLPGRQAPETKGLDQ